MKQSLPKSTKSLASALWLDAAPIRIESWNGGDPDYPGHASDAPTFREFRAARINERVLILLEEEDDDRNRAIVIVRNVRNSVDQIEGALEFEEYEGWRKTGQIPSKLPDLQSRFEKLLSGCYTALPGSDATVANLANLIGLWNGSLSYIQVRDGKALLFAVDAKRTSITNGQFVYDPTVEPILRALRVEFEERSSVAKNTLYPSSIATLWEECARAQKKARIDSLRREIATTESRLNALMSSLDKEELL